MKTLLSFILACFCCVSAYGQAFIRNSFDTNTDAAAKNVVSNIVAGSPIGLSGTIMVLVTNAPHSTNTWIFTLPKPFVDGNGLMTTNYYVWPTIEFGSVTLTMRVNNKGTNFFVVTNNSGLASGNVAVFVTTNGIMGLASGTNPPAQFVLSSGGYASGLTSSNATSFDGRAVSLTFYPTNIYTNFLKVSSSTATPNQLTGDPGVFLDPQGNLVTKGYDIFVNSTQLKIWNVINASNVQVMGGLTGTFTNYATNVFYRWAAKFVDINGAFCGVIDNAGGLMLDNTAGNGLWIHSKYDTTNGGWFFNGTSSRANTWGFFSAASYMQSMIWGIAMDCIVDDAWRLLRNGMTSSRGNTNIQDGGVYAIYGTAINLSNGPVTMSHSLTVQGASNNVTRTTFTGTNNIFSSTNGIVVTAEDGSRFYIRVSPLGVISTTAAP